MNEYLVPLLDPQGELICNKIATETELNEVRSYLAQGYKATADLYESFVRIRDDSGETVHRVPLTKEWTQDQLDAAWKRFHGLRPSDL